MSKTKTLLIGLIAATLCSSAYALKDPTRPWGYSGEGSGMLYGDGFEGLVLNSVLVSKQRQVAVINGTPLKIGDSIGDYKVVAIAPDRVRIKGTEGPITLLLHTETRNMKRSQ